MESTVNNSRKWIILVITTVSVFMSTLDSSIVNIALPVMSKQLHVTINSIQWVITSYLLTISLLLLVWGKLSDLFGKKRIFAAGYLIFSLGSALCGMSHTLPILVLSRIIQAVGASAMMSLSQGIVTYIFPPQERGRALGFVGTMVAFGSLVGPSLGGILVHAFGWQSIFCINIPIGVAGFVLALIMIPEIFETQSVKYFDMPGFLLFSAAMLATFLGLLFAQEGAISVLWLIPLIIISAILILLFVCVERKSKNPLIDLKLFKIPEFSWGLVAAYLSFVALNSSLLFMPFYLQDLLGFDSLKAGIIISVYPLTTIFVAPLSGWLSDKFSFRPFTIAGMVTATCGLLLLSTLNAYSPIAEIIILLFILGLGIAAFQAPNNSSIMGSVPRAQLGIAGGTNALFRNLGFVSGTAFSVLIYSFSTRASISSFSSGMNPAIFAKGFSIIMIFDAACTLTAALISIKRAVPKKAEGCYDGK